MLGCVINTPPLRAAPAGAACVETRNIRTTPADAAEVTAVGVLIPPLNDSPRSPLSGRSHPFGAYGSPFVHRRALHQVSWDKALSVGDPPDVVAADLRWLGSLPDAMRPYGTNRPRPVDAKARYDPDDTFRCNQGMACSR